MSNDEGLSSNDEVYQGITSQLDGCSEINLKTKIEISPLFDPSQLYVVKTIGAFLVYPKEPIYDSEKLNDFVEKNLVPLLDSSFEFNRSEIFETHLHKYIPIRCNSFMTLPCLMKIDEYPELLTEGTHFPAHEIHYHILVFPDESTASHSSLPMNCISSDYSIMFRYSNTIADISSRYKNKILKLVQL